VVLFGDNGTPREAVEAPYNAARAKDTLYQGGLHVPLCVTGPGVAGGRQTDALANVADLYATVLDATGASRATWEAPGQPIDGVSLWPLLQSPMAPPPRAWYFAEATLGPVVRNHGRAARDARYKLLRFNDGREELYDLSMDPRELTDLRARADTDPALGAAYRSLVAVFDRLR
jgi:arylsulfatase A-like enzyme